MKPTKFIKSLLFFVILSFFLFAPLGAEDDPRDSNSPFGVLEFLIWDHSWNSYHYNSSAKIERAVKMMRQAGMGFVRMDFLWADVEPQAGKFDFDRYERIVNILSKNGIKILGVLEYNPAWRPVPWNTAPDPALYEQYVRRVVGHFKDRVRYWEIWNEPDDKMYWAEQDDMKTYTALLKRVYPAIKEVDPTAKVLVGGVSRTPHISLKNIYRQGGKDYFDIANIHPYANPLLPGAIKNVKGIYSSVRQVMVKYGDADKKIWFTELGSPGVATPTRENCWWNGMSPTEEQQAEWVRQVYNECLQWEGVDKVFWAFFRDTHHFNSGIDYFGLVRNDFTPKPAYQAYQEMSKNYQTAK